jgi:hypothetical protein
VGATHGKMIDELTTLKGLNVYLLIFNPFRVVISILPISHRFHRWLFKFYPFGIIIDFSGEDSNRFN